MKSEERGGTVGPSIARPFVGHWRSLAGDRKGRPYRGRGDPSVTGACAGDTSPFRGGKARWGGRGAYFSSSWSSFTEGRTQSGLRWAAARICSSVSPLITSTETLPAFWATAMSV